MHKIARLLLILGCLPPFSAQAQSPDTPLLFYFSPYWHTFVVQAADGSATYPLMPNSTLPHAEVYWAEWSADGEWLAWVYYSDWNEAALEAEYTEKAVAVHVSGEKRLTALDEFIGGVRDITLAWSPDGKLLLASGLVAMDFEAKLYEYKLALIDPATDTIVSSQQFTRDERTYIESHWHADSQMVTVDVNLGGGQAAIYTLSRTDIRELTLAQRNSLTVLPDGDILYSSRSHWYRYNPLTEETLDLGENPCRATCYFSMEWHPTEPLALLRTGARQSDRYHLWLFDLQNNQVEAISHALMYLPFATPYEDYDLPTSHFWSADGQAAVYVEGNGTAYDYDLATRTSTAIAENALYRLWVTPTQVQLFSCVNTTCTTSLYDVETDEQVHRLIGGASASWFSPDGQYAIGVEDVTRLTDLTHLDAIETHEFDWHPAVAPGSEEGGEVIWSGAWALVGRYSAYGYNGTGPRALTVIHAPTRTRYDLDLCEQLNACGWLPAQVRTDLLGEPAPTLSVQPALVLAYPFAFNALAWSPDSQHLATGVQNGLTVRQWQHVLDVTQNTIVQDVGIDEDVATHLEWVADAAGGYQAVITTSEPDYSFENMAATILTSSDTYELRRLLLDPPDRIQKACTQVFVFDRATGTALYPLTNTAYCLAFEPGSPVPFLSSFSISPDERWIVGPGYGSAYLSVWDAQTGQRVTGPHLRAQAVAFSPDGQWLAVKSGRQLHLYAVAEVLPLINATIGQ